MWSPSSKVEKNVGELEQPETGGVTGKSKREQKGSKRNNKALAG
jgi:hypothetical protein